MRRTLQTNIKQQATKQNFYRQHQRNRKEQNHHSPTF